MDTKPQPYLINMLLLTLMACQVTSLLHEVELCSHKSNTTEPKTKVYTFALSDETQGGNVKHNCIIAQMAAIIQLDEDQYLPLDEAKPINVMCSDNLAKFTINYDCAYLHFVLTRKDSNSTMDIALDAEVWYRHLAEHPIKGFKVFTTGYANHSYQCQSAREIPILNKKGEKPYLVLSQVRIEAFRNSTESDFNQPIDQCNADVYSNWLLLALIVSGAIMIFFAIDILFCNCCCCKVLLVFTIFSDLCRCLKCLSPC